MCDMTSVYVADGNQSRHLWHLCAITHAYAWHASLICVACLFLSVWHDYFIWHTVKKRLCTFDRCLIHLCDITHLYVWRVSVYMCDMTALYDTDGNQTWHMCDMTNSYIWHVSLMCVTCLFFCVWQDSFIWYRRQLDKCATWLTHMCDINHSHVWRVSLHVRDRTPVYDTDSNQTRQINTQRLVWLRCLLCWSHLM